MLRDHLSRRGQIGSETEHRGYVKHPLLPTPDHRSSTKSHVNTMAYRSSAAAGGWGWWRRSVGWLAVLAILIAGFTPTSANAENYTAVELEPIQPFVPTSSGGGRPPIADAARERLDTKLLKPLCRGLGSRVMAGYFGLALGVFGLFQAQVTLDTFLSKDNPHVNLCVTVYALGFTSNMLLASPGDSVLSRVKRIFAISRDVLILGKDAPEAAWQPHFQPLGASTSDSGRGEMQSTPKQQAQAEAGPTMSQAANTAAIQAPYRELPGALAHKDGGGGDVASAMHPQLRVVGGTTHKDKGAPHDQTVGLRGIGGDFGRAPRKGRAARWWQAIRQDLDYLTSRKRLQAGLSVIAVNTATEHPQFKAGRTLGAYLANVFSAKVASTPNGPDGNPRRMGSFQLTVPTSFFGLAPVVGGTYAGNFGGNHVFWTKLERCTAAVEKVQNRLNKGATSFCRAIPRFTRAAIKRGRLMINTARQHWRGNGLALQPSGG